MGAATAAGCDVLAYNEVCSFKVVDWTIPAGAADPYKNTVTAKYQVDGFPNTYEPSAFHEVNPFTADFKIEKTGDTLSKIGDEVTYTYTITNLSSSDAK